MKIEDALKNFPLRIALTDYCNLKCFFCSNEGMDFDCKNKNHIDLNLLKKLLKYLRKEGLNNLSITGGEPSLFPKINELLLYIKNLNFPQVFFHTNGTALSKKIIDNYLVSFTKIAVSIHTVNFKTWKKLTYGSKMQFDNLIKNLDYLSKYTKNNQVVVEIKVVPIKGINNNYKNIKDILDFCADHNFKFKFLNFEPITNEQQSYQLPLNYLTKIIEKCGAKLLPKDNNFRGQKSYLPINWYAYKNIKGAAIEIGCGEPNVCKTCYKSNEIFISPNLELKPCHASNFNIPLKFIITNNDKKSILKAILESRKFLKTKPGLNITHWLN